MELQKTRKAFGSPSTRTGVGLRHCCFRCVLSFLASLSMELQKTRKAFGSPSTPGQKISHYSEPSKQLYYSESRLLMDYPFEKNDRGHVFK